MAQNRNGMMSSAPNLVQALRPGGVQSAMEPPVAEYQTPAEGAKKIAYDPQAAAKFQAAMRANRAQRPQMGQQVGQQMGQVAGPGGVQNAMRVFSPEEQQSVAQQMFAGGPNARMPQFGMRNPPFYNPPPGQNMQMEGGIMQNMIDNNAQGSIQDFLAGGGQGGVPPEAYQNYSQQPQQQQAQPQKSGANVGRVRQSPGVYKDPRTGALYGNNGKLMRAGTGRMR